jgi:hypothetical protein
MGKRSVCPEYEKLKQARLDAILALQVAFLQRGLDSTTALREAKVLRDSANERALAHKRECLFCSNTKPVGQVLGPDDEDQQR